ncbi:MAG: hypothetical protein VB102_03210 [Paludibacter sp.]|nr:hypothetical protein [Paludibacter sp.]
MKKVLSILFSAVVLLSGLHLSVAAHFCGEEMTRWKVSFDEEKATCDMCNHESTPVSIDVTSCCKDALTVLNVDKNYHPSQFQLPAVVPHIIQFFIIPQYIGWLQAHAATTLYANIHPPGNYLPMDVNLTDICVFRI